MRLCWRAGHMACGARHPAPLRTHFPYLEQLHLAMLTPRTVTSPSFRGLKINVARPASPRAQCPRPAAGGCLSAHTQDFLWLRSDGGPRARAG